MPVLVQYISATTIAGKAMSGLPIRHSGIAPRRTEQRGVFHRWSSASRLNIQLPRISPRSVRREPDLGSLIFADPPPKAQLLESEEFTLQPLFAGDEPELAPIPLLRFPGIERMLWPETLFSIAYDLADARALVRAEPDLGSLIFADPPPLTDELRPEAADALGALCWVDADTPADKRWALETIGVLRAWARYPSRGRGGFCPEGNAGSRARCARAARKLTQR
jgi:hypothetical protein